jgi:AcrR family transcriptional regulator
MQARLFSAALTVLSKKQLHEISVTDLILEGNVSRGTFYNYFDALSQVFLALSARLDAELPALVDPWIVRIPDAATRLATGTRLILQVGSNIPIFGKLMMQGGWTAVRGPSTFMGFLQRDINAAMAQGTFDAMPTSLAVNLVIGPLLGGLQTMLLEPTRPDYAQQLTLRMLLSLGMARAAAAQAIQVPIPALDWPSDGVVGEILRCSAGRR